MGGTSTKQALGPKIFYLVFGGPTIRFVGPENEGPLIFNVEQNSEEDDKPKTAESGKVPFSIDFKQKFLLVRNEDAYDLRFNIASLNVQTTIRVYTNPSVMYTDSGIQLEPNGDADQFIAYEQVLDPGINLSVDAKRCLSMAAFREAVAFEFAEGADFATVSRCPVAIEIAAVSRSLINMSHLFLFLSVELPAREQSGEHEEMEVFQDEYSANCVKQYVQDSNDIFELHDLFDTNQEVDKEADDFCVVCLSKIRDTAVLPCRHMCLCRDCGVLLQQQSGKCPICRENIKHQLTRHMGSAKKL